jgi:hypothetical protein
MARQKKFVKGEQVVLKNGQVVNTTGDQYLYRGNLVIDTKDGENTYIRVPVKGVKRIAAVLAEQDKRPHIVIRELAESDEEPAAGSTQSLYEQAVNTAAPAPIPLSKYERRIYNKEGQSIVVDVYDVLQAFGVTDPALQHLVKKALAPGQRGHKTVEQDLRDIKASAKRALQLYFNRQS